MVQRQGVKQPSLKIVAIAASAGGFKSIFQILSALPAAFPAAIVVIHQQSPVLPEYTVRILDGEIALRVKQAEHGEQLKPGVVYFAVPNKSLLITPDLTLSLINPMVGKLTAYSPVSALLLSLAHTCKENAIGVVLAGIDGVMGLNAIKHYGGTTIAQTRMVVLPGSTTQAEITTDAIDFVLSPDEIARMLMRLVMPTESAALPEVAVPQQIEELDTDLC